MRTDERLSAVLESVRSSGAGEAEVFHKRGRSRTLRRATGGDVSSLRQEEGWAVRAGDHDRSFFYAASGVPEAETAWPEPGGEGLRLPEAQSPPPWTAPDDLDSPLLAENESKALLDGLARELDRELPGAGLVQAFLEDGSSEQQLISTLGVRARARQRAASLFVEARGARRRGAAVSLLIAEREARRFRPQAVARRLADRLLIAERGEAPDRDRGDFLISHGVLVPILARLLGLFVGVEATLRTSLLTGKRGRLASRHFTLIDDGRLPGGVFESPVDGEGQPTRPVTLIERGTFRQPLIDWRDASSTLEASGCCRRASWRDLPRPGATHLYLAPDRRAAVADLLGSLSRGYYLLAADGAVRLKDGHRRFAVPVSGFAIDGGRPTGSVSGAWLTGSVPSLLSGVVALARDLTFVPCGSALIGAPTVLVRGLELRRRL
ncbi:MAG: metallopeptidase TldD-related protein [Acidobacteriota bacterium]